jgi:hypothetical protein
MILKVNVWRVLLVKHPSVVLLNVPLVAAADTIQRWGKVIVFFAHREKLHR